MRWREVAGFGYAVSDEGKVMRTAPGMGARIGCVLKPRPNRKGYLQLMLCKRGKQFTRTVHKLVAEAFLGPYPEGEEVNHKDGVKTNCRVGNLEYLTRSENNKHAYRLGLFCSRSGESNPAVKLTTLRVGRIRELLASGSFTQRRIGEMFGVSEATISYIKTRKKWSFC